MADPAIPSTSSSPPSKTERVFQGLRDLADRLGIAVRVEPFALRMTGKGGVCKIGGRFVVLIDEKLPVVEQVGVLGEALGKVVPAGFEVASDLRPYLRTGHANVTELLRPRPLARGGGRR